VPGWVGSASTKWLSTLTVLDAPFKGTYMTGSYIRPRHPIEPAEDAERRGLDRGLAREIDDHLARAEREGEGWRARDAARPRLGRRRTGRAREISSDEGKDVAARAASAADDAACEVRVAHLYVRVQACRPGIRHLLARAWDDRGNAQPAVPAWNPLGYFWNGWHRVGVVVEA
jgi:hypothetical protein